LDRVFTYNKEQLGFIISLGSCTFDHLVNEHRPYAAWHQLALIYNLYTVQFFIFPPSVTWCLCFNIIFKSTYYLHIKIPILNYSMVW